MYIIGKKFADVATIEIEDYIRRGTTMSILGDFSNAIVSLKSLTKLLLPDLFVVLVCTFCFNCYSWVYYGSVKNKNVIEPHTPVHPSII